MCAIVGSFNKEKLKELYTLNNYRGELSYSFSLFDENYKLATILKDSGKMPDNLIDKYGIDNKFMLTHSQAPTTDSTTDNIHPASIKNHLMWHNGIIKQKTLPENVWDTHWLLSRIINEGWDILSTIDGTFACVLYDGTKLYVFRNEISPLFYDEQFNFSSTKFDGSISVPPNVVFELNPYEKSMIEIVEFDTFDNPYFFMD